MTIIHVRSLTFWRHNMFYFAHVKTLNDLSPEELTNYRFSMQLFRAFMIVPYHSDTQGQCLHPLSLEH